MRVKCVVGTKNATMSMNKGTFILIDADVFHSLEVGKNEYCRILNVEFVFEEKQINFPSLKELSCDIHSILSLIELNQPYILLKDPCEINPLQVVQYWNIYQI